MTCALKLGIDVAEAAAAERRARCAEPAAARAGAEERHVVEDVLALVQAELAAGQDLPPSAADQ